MTVTVPSSCSFSDQSWEFERPTPGGIVIGVDGSRPSIAALNTAAAIARRRRCRLHAVTVIAPFPSYRIDGVFDHSHDATERLRVALKDSELAAILRMIEPPADWTHEVIIGRAPEVLAHIAESRGSDLLVIGLRSHGIVDRALGDETSIQVMRSSSVPVLATNYYVGNPSVIVAATDFTASSNRAVSAAAELLGISGTLYLVYVDPTAGVLTTTGEMSLADDVATRFRRLVAGLRLRKEVTVEPVVLTGQTVNVIEDFANQVGAEMIAAGSRSQNGLERLFLGSVSTGLVRDCRRPVLVAPPPIGLAAKKN